MKSKIDSVLGKAVYAKRIATAEPPFAHIRHVMGLDRFSFRGKTKVNNQWLLYCIVHNLKKVQLCKYGSIDPSRSRQQRTLPGIKDVILQYFRVKRWLCYATSSQ